MCPVDRHIAMYTIRDLCSSEFGEVGVAHVAGSCKFGVECHGGVERSRRLSALAEFEILAQQWAEVGVRAIVDDFVGPLFRILGTQVGDTLVGDDYIH